MLKNLFKRKIFIFIKKHQQSKQFISFNSKFQYNSNRTTKIFPKYVSIIATTFVCTWYIYKKYNIKLIALSNEAGAFQTSLPTFKEDEVLKHNTKEKGIWVTYKNGVYDITDFVDQHPGNKENILMAAGGSLDPFWALYGFHKTSQIFDLLETMRIGNVNSSDSKHTIEDSNDPYAFEPKRHPSLKPASLKPFNAEPPPSILAENFITPNPLFYVRNHLPVPDIDINSYELEIEIEGSDVRKKTFTIDQLKKQFEQYTVTSSVMCAGNRRSEMTKIKPVKGLDWGPAAIGNATWTGVRLSDVLQSLNIGENDKNQFKHVQFEGLDKDISNNPYGASISFWRAITKKCDVLLAYEMNGEILPRDHGYPLRVIVPGVVGARNVKWLGKIIVSSEESNSHWQKNDYKGFSPSVDWDTVDFSKSPAIQELPVTSAICSPQDLSCVNLTDGKINVKGYAWCGGGNKVIRVDLTCDKGQTWHTANLEQLETEAPTHWSWTLWSINLPVNIKKNDHQLEIWVKATDSNYNTQPESFKNIWNLRGVLCNAYHKIKVNIQK